MTSKSMKDSTKKKIAKSMSDYLKLHPEHGGLSYCKGKKMKKSTKKKMSISSKNSINSGKFKKGSEPWNKNGVLPTELKSQISKTLTGRKVKRSVVKKIAKANAGRSQINTTRLAYQRILKEIPELEKQGFYCIPIGKIIPDIIGIKNGKIYAIEVEYQKNPNYSKYIDNGIYDEVVWILKHPYAKQQ